MTSKQFSSIFSPFRKEAKDCLYPKGQYAWGDHARTLDMMKRLLENIPDEAYPEDREEGKMILTAGKWRLDLGWVDGRKSANLIFLGDDHTAWVVQGEDGEWKDFDIGGS